MTEEFETVRTPDVETACAWYASVFHAEMLAGEENGGRSIRIGSRRYRVVAGADAEPQYDALVRDVDVCIARGATRGGRIVERAHRAPCGARQGQVMDPFGRIWRIRSA